MHFVACHLLQFTTGGEGREYTQKKSQKKKQMSLPHYSSEAAAVTVMHTCGMWFTHKCMLQVSTCYIAGKVKGKKTITK